MKLGRGKAETSKPVALPGYGDGVTLATASGEAIPARVIESSANTLLVAVTVPIRPLSASELDGIVLEFTAPHGRVRLQGTITMENPADPDVLRLDAPRSLEVLQEREYVRIGAARPVLVHCSRDQLQVESYTVDLSGGGLLLAGPDTLKLGDEIYFQLALSAEELPVTGTAKVVRIDPRGRRGVAFEEISDLDQRRLIRFIFDCQRAERRLGLE